MAVGDTDIVWGRCTLSLCCKITSLPWQGYNPSVTYAVRSSVNADITVGIANKCDKPSVSLLTPVCVDTKSCEGKHVIEDTIDNTQYVMITAKSNATPWPWQKWVVYWDDVVLNTGCNPRGASCAVSYYKNSCWSPLEGNCA